MRIDLNADVGESFGVYSLGDDRAVMRSVSSVNVAAGFHGGDPTVLRRTMALARTLGVAVGAHPSFPDLPGFGRREMSLSAGEAEDLVLYQVAAVSGVARAEGVELAHVKPHGALYNMAARDRELAEAIARAVFACDAQLALYAPPRSALAAAGTGHWVCAWWYEGFADRAYRPDGSLVPRGEPDAVIRRTWKTWSTARCRWLSSEPFSRDRRHDDPAGRRHDLHPRRHGRSSVDGRVDQGRSAVGRRRRQGAAHLSLISSPRALTGGPCRSQPASEPLHRVQRTLHRFPGDMIDHRRRKRPVPGTGHRD